MFKQPLIVVISAALAMTWWYSCATRARFLGLVAYNTWGEGGSAMYDLILSSKAYLDESPTSPETRSRCLSSALDLVVKTAVSALVGQCLETMVREALKYVLS